MRFISLLTGMYCIADSVSASGNGTSGGWFESLTSEIPSDAVQHSVETTLQLIRDSFVTTRVFAAGVGNRVRQVCGLSKTSNLTVAVNATAPIDGSCENRESCNTGNHSVGRSGNPLAVFRDRTVAAGQRILDVVFPPSKGLYLFPRDLNIVLSDIWLFILTVQVILKIIILVHQLSLDRLDDASPPLDEPTPYEFPYQIEPLSYHAAEPKWWRFANLGCPYEVLGVALTANPAEIAKAYRTLSKLLHPDKHLGDETAFEGMFRRVAQAYETLRDPVGKGYSNAVCRISGQFGE